MNYLDLAICFFYAYHGDVLGEGSILIHNSHTEMWGTTVEELFELAKHNTPKLFPEEWKSMEAVVEELLEAQEKQGGWLFRDEKERREFFERLPMQILGNEHRVYGAACILYPELLAQVAEREGRNLYIIPSSIHEVIILPDSGEEDEEHLREMIAEVNSTQVEPEEMLSNSLYYFERLTGQIKIA